MAQSPARKKNGRASRADVEKKRRKRGGPFKCSLCGKDFSRASTIRHRHWASCVRKHGNPGNLVWDQDQSCWRKGRSGPSGTPARGLTERSGDDTDDNDYERKKEIGRMDELADTGETSGVWVTSHLMRLRYHD